MTKIINTAVIFIIFSFTFIIQGYSQDILSSKNLSQLKVDQLTDADLLKFQQQLKSSNLSLTDAEQIAISRGLPMSEMAKLKQRLEQINYNSGSASNSVNGNNINNNSSVNNNNNQPVVRNYVPINEQIKNNSSSVQNNKVFGSELFNSNSLSFEPNLHLATSPNYILGPEDALIINIYGLQEVSFSQTISPEGTIFIPTVGVIRLSGMTVQQATEILKNRMAQIGYKSLRNGSSKISIALTKIRSIGITIIGAVKSGNYTISSLSTLFNALYISGGPAANRSFRKIQLIRDSKIFKTIDLYNFLLTGSEADNVALKDNDIIRLPVYDTKVEIEGEVKRPGIFEMLQNEKFSDLLKFASGFSDSAYKAAVKVIQITNIEKRVKDIDQKDFDLYTPASGDFFEVAKILNRFENRVTITGAVFRPGIYEITPGLTVGGLIKIAQGTKEDAYLQRAQIVRLKDDNTSEILSFDVIKAQKNMPDDIPLKREDSVIISSILNLRDLYTVDIEGEIRKPGNYTFQDGLTLKDLLILCGGFTYAAYPQRIEIARLIKRNILNNSDNRLSEIINVQNISDLSLDNKKIDLQPFDVITVRRLPGYFMPQGVTITGMIQFPGAYILASRTERVSDLIKRAGGFLPEAYTEGAFLKRLNNIDTAQKITQQRVNSIEKLLRDSTGDVTNSAARPYDLIPLDLNNILANPNSQYNLILKPQDELHIPRNDQGIKVSGEVFFPTQSPFLANASLKEYISRAGGFTEFAQRKKVYLIYPNGKAVATSHFLFFHKYPNVRSGAEIIVPKKNQRKKFSTAETIGISSALASLAGVVIAIIQLTKK